MKFGISREKLQKFWIRWPDRRWTFLFCEGDNNYSVSTIIFGYNLKHSHKNGKILLVN